MLGWPARNFRILCATRGRVFPGAILVGLSCLRHSMLCAVCFLNTAPYSSVTVVKVMYYSRSRCVDSRWCSMGAMFALRDAVCPQMLAWHASVRSVTGYQSETRNDGGSGPRTQAVPLAFIHDVVARSQAPSTAGPARERLAAGGVNVFNSYVTPSTACWRAGLLDYDALSRVIASAHADVGRVAYSSGVQRRTRHAELEAACTVAGVRGTSFAVVPSGGGASARDPSACDSAAQHEILRTRPWA